MSEPITADEVREKLEQWRDGKLTADAIGETWDDCYAGNVEFALSDGWRIIIFNDCDSVDYVDHVYAPDGREADFDDLWNQQDPLIEGIEPFLKSARLRGER